MRKLIIVALIVLLCSNISNGQGFNSHWLLGYYSLSIIPNQKSRLVFDSTSYQYQLEVRKMGFHGTEATISDANGNFLMSSNGVWIANSSNDTMMNGSGLNPGSNVNSNGGGLLNDYANIILPYPGDTSKFVLFHHTDEWDGVSYPAYTVFYTIIDMTLDGGLGGVTSKNNIAFTDTLNWGLAACRHANGRDWWIVAQKHNSDIIFKILFTPNGVTSVTTQHLNVPFAWYNASQLTFSPQGDRFAYSLDDNSTTTNGTLVYFHFDRCTGIFSNPHSLLLNMGSYIWGLAFSSSGNYIYVSTSQNVFQINVISQLVDTVAIFDGFSSPFPPFYTTFDNMFLAANGKIYITSNNSTSYLHYIDYPDSADTACNVVQHGIYLDSVRHFRAVPNHPNYYLGRLVGSPCDTVWQGVQEQQHDFRFRIYPNPVTSNILHIGYLLPQNKSGKFQIINTTGQVVYQYNLPQWSNEQDLKLPQLANGIYNATIISDNKRVSKTIAIIKE